MKRLLCTILCAMLFVPFVSAHPGRLDNSGGHHDYKNVEGLGDYHYHCGSNYSAHPAHLHENGVCPYDKTAVASTTTVETTTAKATTTTTTAATTTTKVQTTTAKQTTTTKATTKRTTAETTKRTMQTATEENESNPEPQKINYTPMVILSLIAAGIAGVWGWMRSKKITLDTLTRKLYTMKKEYQYIVLAIPAVWVGFILFMAKVPWGMIIFGTLLTFAIMFFCRKKIFTPPKATPTNHVQTQPAYYAQNLNYYSFRRESEIISASIKMVNTTSSLTTFITRYDTIKGCFERISAIPGKGQDAYRGWQQALDMYPDRLTKVIERCVAEANALQTTKGRANRFEKYIDEFKTAHAYNDMIADAIEVQTMYLQALRDECIVPDHTDLSL